MKWVLIIGGVVAALGLFLLATASGDTAVFERQYPLILGLNAAFAALLAALVAYQLVAIVRRYRARVFGTRLTLRQLRCTGSTDSTRHPTSRASWRLRLASHNRSFCTHGGARQSMSEKPRRGNS